MASPTALTPEPANDSVSLDLISISTSSMDDQQDPISISLSSSPLTVRTVEESPFKPGYAARKALQDTGENTNMNTPNRPGTGQVNQTPLRSTPLLTPPSSDERPRPQHLPVEALSSPLFHVPAKQVSLTDKIMAQSALYSQAIQKKQQTSPTSLVHSVTKKAITTLGDPPASNPAFQRSQQPSIPGLTYHQLQQQQFLANRQQLPSIAESPNDAPQQQAESTRTLSEQPVLTVFELPSGEEVKSPESKPQAEKTDASKQIVTIPKPDPLDNPLNTTNVYINGLPLRWSDDDLYRLTRGFGAVKSVKMFTRHLEDKPSAYGFVLFNCVDDAERFILALRQHTQFHPSFAKTHKVPGTTNAKHAIADPIIPVPRDEEYADVSIIGLPLNIDMQTLRAVFAPQVLKASKFFHTAGTPRRLVGFVRLESKKAAEEIIERLHGSNVLGWSEKLNVQMIGSGSSKTSGIPELQPTGFSVIQQEPPVSRQSSLPLSANPQQLSAPTPSLGVYQHNDLQMTDFNRLFGSMKINNVGRAVQPSRPYSQQFQYQHDLPAGVTYSQASLHNHSPSNSFDLAQAAQTHSPMASIASRQFRPSFTTNGVGLGIGTASSLHDLSYAAPATQNSASTQDMLQRTLFQGMEEVSPELVQAIQAAVAAQDGAFAHFNSAPVINGSGFGTAKLMPEMPWAAMNNPTLGPRGRSLQRIDIGSNFGDFTPVTSNGMPLQGAPASALDTKVPPPILPSTNLSAVTSGAVSSKGVPFLLPALSPSSPQASSEESSPITPTFPQGPTSFVAGQTNDS